MPDFVIQVKFKYEFLGFYPGEQPVFYGETHFGVVAGSLTVYLDGNLAVFIGKGRIVCQPCVIHFYSFLSMGIRFPGHWVTLHSCAGNILFTIEPLWFAIFF